MISTNGLNFPSIFTVSSGLLFPWWVGEFYLSFTLSSPLTHPPASRADCVYLNNMAAFKSKHCNVNCGKYVLVIAKATSQLHIWDTAQGT